ncbi:TetR/AcrR family transcriptional regulator [Allohahella sp. A8]|uniref:TetR/AcrR family transcriptional regulator n=1 Tax=Allohahella sp. A8 TaxID=3141461 RepID=UPI000C0B79D5|nr:TetR family transcriptional regulator [Hahellaceae bacterium]|tara:strand:+ start:11549 stop:12190 length:642 start_codon:yes stop_codon:yes gene_type:complete
MAYRETEKMRLRKAGIRQRIFDCAYHRVSQGGFRNASINLVAEDAGVATGSVYRHFESKAELFAEVFREATQIELDKVESALTGQEPALVRLERAIRQFAERALRGPVMAWSLIAEPVDPLVEEERLNYRRSYAEFFERVILEGIEAGTLPPQDAHLSATCLVGALAESLVGPLSPQQQGPVQMPPVGDQSRQKVLIEPIIDFCMQGVSGQRR